MADHLSAARDTCRRNVRGCSAGHDGVLLEFAIDDLAHALDEQAVFVFGQQRSQSSPQMTLMTFQPAPRKAAFELLNDLAVAAHRAVEPLQVAVDDEDQVVALFARSQRDGAERFGLVAFAVAQKGPDVRLAAILDAAIGEIRIEASLVNGRDRGNAHRDGGKFPEVGHQPGMRIAGQPAAFAQLLTEVFQLLFAQPAFEECPGVDARRGMALEVDLVAAEVAALAAEEVIEGHFVQSGGRSVGGDMAADAV